MAKVYLGLGTNLGNKEQNLRTAVDKINERIGEVVSLSAFYVTTPWGFNSPNSFLNAACCVETILSVWKILESAQQIEREMGRKNKSVGKTYTDRLIDIDLLLCGNAVLKTHRLTLPHPLMTQRDFVMKPLLEIAPDVIHPVFHKRLCELLS